MMKNRGEKLQKCLKCEKQLPLTSEYYHNHKNYKTGFHKVCKKCKNKYDRERWQKMKDLKAHPEMEKLNDKAEKGYQKLLSEPRNYGVGHMLNTLNFSKGKRYLVIQSKDKLRTGFDEIFEGELVYNNQEHITLKHNLGYRESFRKFDILCGDIKIKEV